MAICNRWYMHKDAHNINDIIICLFVFWYVGVMIPSRFIYIGMYRKLILT